MSYKQRQLFKSSFLKKVIASYKKEAVSGWLQYLSIASHNLYANILFWCYNIQLRNFSFRSIHQWGVTSKSFIVFKLTTQLAWWKFSSNCVGIAPTWWAVFPLILLENVTSQLALRPWEILSWLILLNTDSFRRCSSKKLISRNFI